MATWFGQSRKGGSCGSLGRVGGSPGPFFLHCPWVEDNCVNGPELPQNVNAQVLYCALY